MSSKAEEEVQLVSGDRSGDRKRRRMSSEIEAQRKVLKKKELAILELQRQEYAKMHKKMIAVKAKGVEAIQKKLDDIDTQMEALRMETKDPDTEKGNKVLEKYSASAKFMRSTTSQLDESRISAKPIILPDNDVPISKPTFTTSTPQIQEDPR
eukprot:CAMPEP_0197314112 /NCGR_PEP_ID=MMETSP0891-20130614/32148_1 /TAXON_ID=44058 ORGANISM="Aureoumbra lagunensis, Strain CCMP1510" /NCGR_SAMPLE_ID=MMETSP0891 /ASSEMBLY_ACC=CAM_ASM_000534 /LENGTH=152 /DNA_ID=CAMNT_0042802385 /DNA_START=9 /DNA_END=467 /DNA_ORIENTATION=+